MGVFFNINTGGSHIIKDSISWFKKGFDVRKVSENDKKGLEQTFLGGGAYRVILAETPLLNHAGQIQRLIGFVEKLLGANGGSLEKLSSRKEGEHEWGKTLKAISWLDASIDPTDGDVGNFYRAIIDQLISKVDEVVAPAAGAGVSTPGAAASGKERLLATDITIRFKSNNRPGNRSLPAELSCNGKTVLRFSIPSCLTSDKTPPGGEGLVESSFEGDSSSGDVLFKLTDDAKAGDLLSQVAILLCHLRDFLNTKEVFNVFFNGFSSGASNNFITRMFSRNLSKNVETYCPTPEFARQLLAVGIDDFAGQFEIILSAIAGLPKDVSLSDLHHHLSGPVGLAVYLMALRSPDEPEPGVPAAGAGDSAAVFAPGPTPVEQPLMLDPFAQPK